MYAGGRNLQAGLEDTTMVTKDEIMNTISYAANNLHNKSSILVRHQ